MSGVASFALGALFSVGFAWVWKKAVRLDKWNDSLDSGEQPIIKPKYVKGGTSFYELAETFTHKSIDNSILTIDEGFIFDGASIPSLFWQLMGSPFSANMLKSALIHDYRHSRIFRKESPYTRDEKRDLLADADYEFYCNLREAGNRKIVAWLCYKAVRFYSILKGVK